MFAYPNPGIIASMQRVLVPSGPVSGLAPPSRDWGIQTLTSANTSSLILGGLEMAATIGGPDLCTGGQGYARRTNTNPSDVFGTSNVLFDGSVASAVAAAVDNDHRMQGVYEFASPQTPVEVRLAASNGSIYGPLGFVVIVSYDGRLTWQPVALFSTPAPWATSEQRAFSFTPTLWSGAVGRHAARAWRIVMNGWPASGSPPQIGDMAFAATPGGATLCAGGTAITGRSGSFFNPQLAFDGVTSSYWTGVFSTLGQTVGYGFTAPVDVSELRLRSRSSAANQMPTDFDVQWSTDFWNWTTALTVSGLSWTTNETKAFAIP